MLSSNRTEKGTDTVDDARAKETLSTLAKVEGNRACVMLAAMGLLGLKSKLAVVTSLPLSWPRTLMVAGSVEPSSSGQVVHGAAKMQAVEAKIALFVCNATSKSRSKYAERRGIGS